MTDRPCSVDGCQRPVKRRGLCQTHLKRVRVSGDAQDDTPIRVWGGCRVCENPRRSEIDALLLGGSPASSSIATEFGLLHRQYVRRHARMCLGITWSWCPICRSPDRDEIDVTLAAGMTADYTATHFGFTPPAVYKHARVHLGLNLRGGQRCLICAHPHRDEMETAAFAARNINALCRDLGVPAPTLRYHLKSHLGEERARAEAEWEIRRLSVVQGLTGR